MHAHISSMPTRILSWLSDPQPPSSSCPAQHVRRKLPTTCPEPEDVPSSTGGDHVRYLLHCCLLTCALTSHNGRYTLPSTKPSPGHTLATYPPALPKRMRSSWQGIRGGAHLPQSRPSRHAVHDLFDPALLALGSPRRTMQQPGSEKQAALKQC